jgi:phenylacetate-coenzyme A ligase PaaK-like adenylate-forming protein
MGLYMALGAINHLTQGTLGAEDVVQISTSSRATLGNSCFAGACARLGALVTQTGLVDPGYSLNLLHEEQTVPGKARRPTFLLTYASYLGALVEEATARGWGPGHFSLRRIAVGGEPVTAGLKRRAAAIFGPVQWDEGFGQTETWPATGQICPAGHLHFEPTQALVEVLDPQTGAPTPPGAIGNLVLTALPPYREAQIILRYDTGDLVQTLAAPPTCAWAHLPAVSNLLGKRALAVQHADGQWTTPRQILAALEEVDAVPLPARTGWWAVPGGVAVEVAVPQPDAARPAIGAALEAAGVPLRELHVHAHPADLQRPFPWRGDLRETLFPPLPGRVPVGASQQRTTYRPTCAR